MDSASHLVAVFEVLWIPCICWAAQSILCVLASLWLLFGLGVLSNITALEENLPPLIWCVQMCALCGHGADPVSLMLSVGDCKVGSSCPKGHNLRRCIRQQSHMPLCVYS